VPSKEAKTQDLPKETPLVTITRSQTSP